MLIPLRELPTAFTILRRCAIARLGGAPTGGAQCLLVRDDGAVLFVKASYRSHWSLPGGFMEPGEDAVLAACRELTEETGLRGRDPFLVGTDVRRYHRDHLVAARYSPDDPVDEASTAWEINEARWVTRDEYADVHASLHVNSKRLLNLVPGTVPTFIDRLLTTP